MGHPVYHSRLLMLHRLWFLYLWLFGGDRRVAADEFGEDAAEGLDAKGERRHVQEEHVRHVAGQHASLD